MSRIAGGDAPELDPPSLNGGGSFCDLVDEAVERMRAGTSVELDFYLRGRPEHAEVLRQVWRFRCLRP
jgi:hypothetical protein